MSEIWSTVRESLAGSHREYTDGPIGRAILLLAIPMVLELLLESVFAVGTVFFVARRGADAVATVGLTTANGTLVLWVANAFNLVLDPCLIFGLGPFPRLGVAGAAVATTTGRSIGVAVQLFVLSRGAGRVVIRREHLRIEPRIMWNMLRLSGT